MSLIRWRRRPTFASPFSMMQGMLDEFDRLGRLAPWTSEDDYGPAVDVYETDDEVIVKAHLPGVNKEELDVTVQDNQLIIRAETKREEEVDEEGYFRREIRYGTFARSLPLPAEVDEEQVTAKLADGVLEVHAKKAEKPAETGKKIQVE